MAISSNNPPWLESQRQDVLALLERRKLPQALLIHGPAGVGRRYLGLWTAARLLNLPDAPIDLAPLPESEAGISHPDFLGVSIPTDKRTIRVEQVRELIEFLQLTSHQGGNRVVLLWPAEAMTREAANSLLKTLEEPPDGSTIILVAESTGRLPATVVSRCHRLRINVPGRAESVSWLTTCHSQVDWELLLDFALDAPLMALAMHRCGFIAKAGHARSDIDQLRQRRIAPVMVARRWASAADARLLLRWLYGQVAESVRKASVLGVASRVREPLQISPNRLNMRRLVRRLRNIEEASRSCEKAVNLELQLTALLTDWYGETTDAS